MIDVTLTFTVILSIFMLILSVRILDLRGSPVTNFLHKPERKIDQQTIERAIRGHGNLVEYAPLFLILMLVLELGGTSQHQLYLSGVIFTVGRLIHGICFSFMRSNMVLRIGGMALTFMGFIGLISCSIPIIF
mgnify:FL=1